MTDLSLAEARRLALAAQGFTDPRPRSRVDIRHVRRVFDRVGLIQIDSVNVLVRSHYLPLFSRLGPYPMSLLDEATYGRRELFETWAHEACLVPTADHALFRHRMAEGHPWRRVERLRKEHPDYFEAVLDEVRRRGGLTAGELDDPGERHGPWWGYGKGKVALEHHFAEGRLAVRERRNFARVYDLAERVLPSHVLNGETPDEREAQRTLLLRAARSMGVATTTDLADYYRMAPRRARELVRELADEGQLEAVRVEGWKQEAYRHPEVTLPRRVEGSALLSPFDSLVWNRQRVERLFGFHYRIEIYVPAKQRRYGYYVLPYLLDGELVARVDLKSDRERGVLSVRGIWLEDGAPATRVREALSRDLGEMSGWLGLGEVEGV